MSKGNAGRNGGEDYTPRPPIRAIVNIIDPKVGEEILDPADGSAGFLCEASEYMKASKDLSTEEITLLQTSTFYGRDVKSLAYIIGIMNMILHGIEAPNIVHTNALAGLPAVSGAPRSSPRAANMPSQGVASKVATRIQCQQC